MTQISTEGKGGSQKRQKGFSLLGTGFSMLGDLSTIPSPLSNTLSSPFPLTSFLWSEATSTDHLLNSIGDLAGLAGVGFDGRPVPVVDEVALGDPGTADGGDQG